MKQYLMGLFALAICCGVVEQLFEGGALGKHLKLMSALSLLCVLISPVSALLQEGVRLPSLLSDWTDRWLTSGEQEGTDYEERWEQEGERLDVAYAEQTVARMVEEQFSLSSGECQVRIQLGSDGQSIERMHVGLSGSAIWANSHQIKNDLSQAFGCLVEIYVE